MDVPERSVAPADAGELQRMRWRAYGPDADIARDPAAQAGMSELEAAIGQRVLALAGGQPDDPARWCGTSRRRRPALTGVAGRHIGLLRLHLVSSVFLL
ncbi:MAG TPA: hypothetical protein VFY91_05510 [Microbacterium sp.]|nr:hypothetical protein [Microbacterium sp.]